MRSAESMPVERSSHPASRDWSCPSSDVATSQLEEPSLSERQNEVLRLVAKGYTYPEIAKKLFISQKTIQNHVHDILTKLHLRKRYELMRYAIQRGIDRLPE